MSQTLSLPVAIDSTLEVIKLSEDYSDCPTIASFMILINTLLENPTEIVNLNNSKLADLAFCMSCIQTSDFTKEYPKYYTWSTGRIVSAIGFYAFMKQLDNSYLLESHYPAFIVLMHDGRKFMSHLFLHAVIIKEDDFLLPMDETWRLKEGLDITKDFEFLLYIAYQKNNLLDRYTKAWFDKLDQEIYSIRERLYNRNINTLEIAKYMYHVLENSFNEGKMPNYLAGMFV